MLLSFVAVNRQMGLQYFIPLNLKHEHKDMHSHQRKAFWLKSDLITQENGLCTGGGFPSTQPKLRLYFCEHLENAEDLN